MKRPVLKILCFLTTACLGQPLMAAPTVHLFEPPPSLLKVPIPTGSQPQTIAPAGVPAQMPTLPRAAAQPQTGSQLQATGAAAPPPAVTPPPAEANGGCKVEGSFSYEPGITTVLLDFVRARFTINNPENNDPQKDGEDPVELRSYGGCKSGPVVRISPGNTLRFDLRNETNRKIKDGNVVDVNTRDALDPTCLDNPPKYLALPPGVGCFDTTNLHTHGLHVSPAGNGDNVLLDINPGTRFLYEINVPADHWAGTFWYHAHRHGSTAVQVASGAAGMLIVNGTRVYNPTKDDPHPIADIDTVLLDADGAPLKENLFLLQQIAYACFQNMPGQPRWQNIYTVDGLYNAGSSQAVQDSPWTCPTATPDKPVTPGVIENFSLQLDSPTIWDTNGRFTSINGVVQPVFTLPAGEIQRWRFAHGGIHDTANLQIVRSTWQDKPDLTQGYAPHTTPLLTGNRAEQQFDVREHCKATPESIVPQFEIASDGVTRTKLHSIGNQRYGEILESNYLQPGYRSDVLVTFPEDGIYCLLNQAAPAQERAHNGNNGGQGPSAPELLAYVFVRGGKPIPTDGAGKRLTTADIRTYIEDTLYKGNEKKYKDELAEDMKTPDRPLETAIAGLKKGDLSPWAPFVELPPANTADPQHADFAIGPPPGSPPNAPVAFTINGQSYDPSVATIVRQVNTTDDWLLTAQGEPHIFHIHVNPFEIVDVTTKYQNGQQISIFDDNGDCIPMLVADASNIANQYCGMYHVFKDTIFVEPNYQVHIRTRYDRYIGEYVIHCHILDHEDAGMMLNVSIVPDLNAVGGGLGMAMHHHADAGTPAMAGMAGMAAMTGMAGMTKP